MGFERLETATRYAKAAVRHPDRAIRAAFSELTGIRTTVNFRLGNDSFEDFYGELPDRLTRFLYMMEGIKDYEPETRAMMNHVVGKGDTVIVIGAHIGTHAVYARQLVGDGGKVVAFEPTPDTFSVLKANCDSRGIVAEQLAVTRHGLAEVSMTSFRCKICLL